ncbi:hypothetical protein [Streptomyces sp. NPDC086989]|uniref:hypothetical protein n=1 Tax=Streptomyces sp. NPDC086989 TaxID=3365764 RepID=UPI0006BB297A|nr:hypothetical protein OV450_5673 [Actinobacteria bacterium OV450]
MRSFMRVIRVRVAAGAFALVALLAVAGASGNAFGDIGWPNQPKRPAVAGDIGWPNQPKRPVVAGDIGWPAPVVSTAARSDIGWPTPRS